jgi:hypothetical protein
VRGDEPAMRHLDRSVQRRQFWKTAPGIITAVAGLISAIAALTGGLAAAGVIGGSRPVVGSPASGYSTPSHNPTASRSPGSVTPSRSASGVDTLGGGGPTGVSAPSGGPSSDRRPRPRESSPSAMQVNVSADPPQILPSETTAIGVEVLSAPDSPIKGATVRIELGGGVFLESGALDITGTTNAFGFFAAHWQCPPSAPEPSGYYVTATVSKPGYIETSKRITVNVK